MSFPDNNNMVLLPLLLVEGGAAAAASPGALLQSWAPLHSSLLRSREPPARQESALACRRATLNQGGL